MANPLHLSAIPSKARPKPPDLGLAGLGAMGIYEPMDVQEKVWRLHEARTPLGLPLFENVAVEVPRRAGKTDSLLALAVGRCGDREDFNVTYCAQSGQKSRVRFYSLLRRMRRHGPGGWRARESRGEEQIEWENGSILRFMPPKAASFRGDAEDWVILDEAQEVDEEDAADLIGSILPIFDTREDAQLTVAGTAGAVRSGLLWEALEKGRRGEWGILEYAGVDGMDIDDERQWLRIHPGPAGVTQARALEVLRKRRKGMTSEMFGREYLGIWPLSSAHAAFDLDLWQRLGRELAGETPKRFGLAFDVTPGGRRTAVMAVWRDADGTAWGEVLREDAGTRWAVDFVGQLAKKYRLPAGHDTAGTDTLALADDIKRRYPATRLRGLTTIEFATACAVIDDLVRNARFGHFRQAPFDEAVAAASRRTIRDGGWAWGRMKSSGDIHTLVGATVALRLFDDLPAQRSVRIVTAS